MAPFIVPAGLGPAERSLRGTGLRTAFSPIVRGHGPDQSSMVTTKGRRHNVLIRMSLRADCRATEKLARNLLTYDLVPQ